MPSGPWREEKKSAGSGHSPWNQLLDSAIASYQMVEIKSNEKGMISLRRKWPSRWMKKWQAIMVTNPNTLGFIEEHLSRDR